MTTPAPKPHSDQKEALSSGRKPDLTHMRMPSLVYNARACEYGIAKGYARGNFLRPTVSLREDFLRLRAYLAATMRHVAATLDAMEAHHAADPELVDENGMRRAAYCADEDQDLTGTVGPSGLPHLCGAVASLNMLITQATRAGLLPADPGQPWVARAARDREIERRNLDLLAQERQEFAEQQVWLDELAALRCRCDSTPVALAAGDEEPAPCTEFARSAHGGVWRCVKHGVELVDGWQRCPRTLEPRLVPVDLPLHAPAPLTDAVSAGAARFDQRPIERASVDARAELEPEHCTRCFPGKPGRELIDCGGSAGFKPCTGCVAKPEPAAPAPKREPLPPASPSDPCTRGQPLGDLPWCGTHDVPLDTPPRGGAQVCRLTQREVP